MPGNALETYKFNAQPFELGRFDVERIGRANEWARLNQLLSGARQSRAPTFGVLLGTYGSGKSYLMWQLAKSVALPKTSKVLASIPIRLIDPEQKRDFIRNLALRFFSKGIDIETQLAPLLKGMKSEDFLPSRLRPSGALLLALARGDAAARRVVTGGKALAKEAQAGGFGGLVQIKTQDDAINLIQGLQCLVRAAGVECVALFIDEIEYIENMGKAPRVAVLDSLKHLWDQEVEFASGDTEGASLLMLLSATPNFWTKARQGLSAESARADAAFGLTPFFSRIRSSEVIEIPAELEKDEARQLIVSRMSEVRAGKKEEIIPFTDDFVAYVYEMSKGLPRLIIEICGVVLSEAGAQKLKSIDKNAAKRILRELLISYEPT